MTCAPTIQATAFPRVSWFLLTRVARRPLLALALSAGVLLGILPFMFPNTVALSAETQVSGLEDGNYVFGQSEEADQIGSTYMVMTVESQRVLGAFYQPSSSFDCFQGYITGNQLALVVQDSYDQSNHPYNLALETSSSEVAARIGTSSSLVPSGFHQLEALSELDHTILETCSAAQPF